MSDERLRLLARGAIRERRIPDRRPEHMWGGSGRDNLCTICKRAVGGLGLDLEFALEDGVVEHPVHVDCYAAWRLECQDAGASPPSAAATRVATQES